MAKINGLDKFSYVELINLQERVEEAIAAKRAEDAQATKEQLRAMAEKAGFDIKELLGHQGALVSSSIAIQKTARRRGRVGVVSPTG